MTQLIVPYFAEGAPATVTIDGVTYRVARVDSNGRLSVAVNSSALPSGAATSARQDTVITALQLIDDLRDALGSVGGDDLRVRILWDSGTSPNGVANNVKVVTTAGTQVQLQTQACHAVSIKAHDTNTGLIYLGDSGVSSANGRRMEPSEVVDLMIDNVNRLWIDSAVDGEGVSWLVVT